MIGRSPFSKRSRWIGERLRKLRSRKGLTQAQLAKYLGVSGTLICKYETGQSRVPFEAMIQIVDRFGVTLDYFRPPEDAPAEGRATPRQRPQKPCQVHVSLKMRDPLLAALRAQHPAGVA